jgi:hypothetical protein
MPVEKGMVPVIEVGAIPDDLVIIQPGGAELGLETFAEASFGLGIDVDAFYGIHVNSWSVLMFLMFGRLKVFCFGNGAGRDGGWLAGLAGLAGWISAAEFSQFGFAALFNLRR